MAAGMAAESSLVWLILQKLDELADLVSSLDDGRANTVLPAGGSNSVVQVAVHCCGMMRRWSSSGNLDDMQRTDLSAAPAVIPPGREDFWAVSCEGVLLHVLEELCQHPGHAEITRDMVLMEAGEGAAPGCTVR